LVSDEVKIHTDDVIRARRWLRLARGGRGRTWHCYVPTTGFNQDGTEVITVRRTVMVYRRGQAPRIFASRKA